MTTQVCTLHPPTPADRLGMLLFLLMSGLVIIHPIITVSAPRQRWDAAVTAVSSTPITVTSQQSPSEVNSSSYCKSQKEPVCELRGSSSAQHPGDALLNTESGYFSTRHSLNYIQHESVPGWNGLALLVHGKGHCLRTTLNCICVCVWCVCRHTHALGSI